jgi:trans-2,3-dihydro-3-hydroxyanthranilate isomerase
MPTLKYQIVDVFTTEALEGNPLAVFTEASQIDEMLMQKIAREMNLAETTFVLPSDIPTCAARVRIFTPKREMVFAGHPTIGTSFVLFTEGRLSNGCESFFLEEKVGRVQIWFENRSLPMIWLRTPPISEGKLFDRRLCARAVGLKEHDLLSIPPQLLDAGNPTLFIAVNDEQAVDKAWLDLQDARSLRGDEAEPFCVFVFAPTKGGAYSRMFAPEYGVPEDPATGSSTGPLAVYMMKHGLLAVASGTRFISEQGKQMGRRSLLHVKIASEGGGKEIFVGGHVTPIAEGEMKI